MAKQKYYAVKKGKKQGIFTTWDACRASVEGFGGAQYKSFATEQEARAYLGEVPCKEAEPDRSGQLPDHLTAYVDGSFDVSLGRYAYGCVLLTPSGEIIRKSGGGDSPECVALRNVAGEMLGAMYAVKWAQKAGFEGVEICYDYMGIEMWATGGWKTKNELTRKYAAFMQESSRTCRISFRKIAAHTGDKYNEEADKLAKAALVQGKSEE